MIYAARVTALVALLLVASCGQSRPAATSTTTAPAAGSTSLSTPSAAATSTSRTESPGFVVVAVADRDGTDARSVSVAVGQLLYVDLATCGGCGYEWRVDNTPDAAVLTKDKATEQPTTSSTAAGAPLVGQPTTKRFAFAAQGAGATQVRVSYYPPAKKAPDRTVVVTVKVT